MKINLLIYILCFNVVIAFSKNADLFKKANDLYVKKNYEEAKNSYLQILKNNKYDASIYYNLGNCFFQLKNYPSAILAYEKALKIAPNHPSIKHNLELANQKGIDKNEHSNTFFLVQWTENFYLKFSSKSWAIVFLISFWILSISTFVYFRNRNVFYLKLNIFLLLISILFFYLTNKKYQYETTLTHAIVMKDSELLSKPSSSAKIIGNIVSGKKVKLLDKDADYLKIKLLNGKVVWTKKQNLATY